MNEFLKHGFYFFLEIVDNIWCQGWLTDDFGFLLFTKIREINYVKPKFDAFLIWDGETVSAHMSQTKGIVVEVVEIGWKKMD